MADIQQPDEVRRAMLKATALVLPIAAATTFGAHELSKRPDLDPNKVLNAFENLRTEKTDVEGMRAQLAEMMEQLSKNGLPENVRAVITSIMKARDHRTGEKVNFSYSRHSDGTKLVGLSEGQSMSMLNPSNYMDSNNPQRYLRQLHVDYDTTLRVDIENSPVVLTEAQSISLTRTVYIAEGPSRVIKDQFIDFIREGDLIMVDFTLSRQVFQEGMDFGVKKTEYELMTHTQPRGTQMQYELGPNEEVLFSSHPESAELVERFNNLEKNVLEIASTS